ncbi:MAG TPA: L-seryl-tRNA(Sec) selenium transferase [Silvibacterium sp.]|nr:L-seryl-tRNA(Sec) selenium transferase [Silvibacterium sp.]
MAAKATGSEREPDNLYSLLPSVNDLLLDPAFSSLVQSHSHDAVVHAVRAVLLRLKQEIGEGQHTRADLQERLAILDQAVLNELTKSTKFSLRRVINATGVILHTNLGRAPLSASALEHLVEVAQGYSNLELDLETGERSRRDVHVEELLLRLFRARAGITEDDLKNQRGAAVVVNNCAAATFLGLNSLADGAEVVVSRGELVEIGGGFRIPEILAKSGARLREVGTTNRTRLSDYEKALSPDTALILRVHQSNFRMEGFTERPALEELVLLGARKGVPVFDDQGTGLILPLDDLGVRSEPTVIDSFRLGSDLIAASGDKLLGGPQCGLLVGREDLIERIRANPLLRTFRVDKLTYAALEATLTNYLQERLDSIPVVNMLRLSREDILRRCGRIADELHSSALTVEVVPVESLIGGGTAPASRLPSAALALRHEALSLSALLLSLRRLQPPIIARVSDDRVLLDLRTVEPESDVTLVSLLQGIARGQEDADLPKCRPSQFPLQAGGKE